MSESKLQDPDKSWKRLISEAKLGKTRHYFQMRREYRALKAVSVVGVLRKAKGLSVYVHGENSFNYPELTEDFMLLTCWAESFPAGSTPVERFVSFETWAFAPGK